MADGYLESHYAEYEQRKAAWLKKKKKIQPRPLTPKPEDEALYIVISKILIINY